MDGHVTSYDMVVLKSFFIFSLIQFISAHHQLFTLVSILTLS